MITQEQDETRSAWDSIADGYDTYVTPTHMWLAEVGLRRADVGRGTRFLDIAAGSGALSIPAARLGARVLSIDISAQMLDRLKRRAKEENLDLETRVMDGHALEVEDNRFDVAGSQFGVMLCPDKQRALREMVRVVHSGGRVLMHVYGNPQKIDFLTFFISALQCEAPQFAGLPTDPPPLPFELQDPEKLHHALSVAGLKDVRIETITEKLEFATGEQLWNWVINSNPIARHILSGLSLTEQQIAAVRKTLEKMIRNRAGDEGTAVLTNPIHIALGTK